MTASSQSQAVAAAAKAPIPEPPQEVMVAWINYMLKEQYARTGQWPMPGSESLPTLPAAYTVYQPPLQGLATPGAATEHHHKHSRASRRTNFNYQQSEYWAAAGRLIEEQAARPVAVELRYGCQMVLSLILAWMHYPLFNGTGGRGGEWMTLGCDRMCKELRITGRNVLSCMYELERCGLVLPGRLETGIISRLEFDTLKADIPMLASSFWQARCVQQKSTFYRLKPGVARPSLPVFNPFLSQTGPERAEKDVGRAWEGPEKDLQSSFELEEPPERASEVLPTSFSGLHDSEYEHDMKIEKVLEKEMGPDQLEKYTFLRSIHEMFPGSRCGEMLDQAAVRLSSQYEMPTIKAAFKKVSRDWSRNGHLIENPVALFISQLAKQAARPTGSGHGGRGQQSGPINFYKYTTGKYAKLTQNNNEII
jgi:hypothetical protein